MSLIAQRTSTLQSDHPVIWEQITDEFDLDDEAKQVVSELFQVFEREETLDFKKNFYVFQLSKFDVSDQDKIINSIKEITKQLAVTAKHRNVRSVTKYI